MVLSLGGRRTLLGVRTARSFSSSGASSSSSLVEASYGLWIDNEMASRQNIMEEKQQADLLFALPGPSWGLGYDTVTTATLRLWLGL
jgi:hypothetical protein